MIIITFPDLTALPDPVSHLEVIAFNATTLSINWTVSGEIDYINITYNYTVKSCSAMQSTPLSYIMLNSTVRSYILKNANEDSSYTITVRAINTIGSSKNMTTVDTPTAGMKIYNFVTILLLFTKLLVAFLGLSVSVMST